MKIEAKPFMKFPGGKRAIIKELLDRIPPSYNKYYEPFLGGGALFFALSPKKAYLSDVNSELIRCYQVIKHDVEGLISSLELFPYARKPGAEKVNKKIFETIRAWDRKDNFHHLPGPVQAARTIYLNRTCYNGLFRVNSKSQFNTPFGKYTNPQIVDSDNLRACSDALRQIDVQCHSFEDALEEVHTGDFVYLDPPYYPASDTANFTAYSSKGFSDEDHRALARACKGLDDCGVHFMLTNSNVPATLELYRDFNIEVIDSPRSINREKSTDIIVRNYR